jgi:PRTRC genetic system protein D
MLAGIDVGYARTKVVGSGGRFSFASVTGTVDRSRFGMNGREPGVILTEPRAVMVGDDAVRDSRHLKRREDRGWIESEEYHDLVLAALSELSEATWAKLTVVSGLPIAFFDKDKAALKATLEGEHRFTRDGRRAQTFTIEKAVIIPQGFGALLSVCLDDRGNIQDPDLANGAIGLVDLGGKTTNLLSINRLSEVSRETESVPVGAWDAVRTVGRWLSENCPKREYRDHEIEAAIKAGETTHTGQPVDLSEPIREALQPMADQVIAQATQLWNGAGQLDGILIAGGGAHLLGQHIVNEYEANGYPAGFVRVIDGDPVFANAVGYWKFARRITK